MSQLPPAVFDLYLEALPDISLTPVARFAEIANDLKRSKRAAKKIAALGGIA